MRMRQFSHATLSYASEPNTQISTTLSTTDLCLASFYFPFSWLDSSKSKRSDMSLKLDTMVRSTHRRSFSK